MCLLKMLLLSFVALPLLFAQAPPASDEYWPRFTSIAPMVGISRTNPDTGKEPLQIQDSSSSANRAH